jgi:hypothetical protein
MLTAYFDLGEDDIQRLKLSDKIRIDNSWWHINRVVDYNANKDQLTKVELISVDEEIDLPNFRTKRKITEPVKGVKGNLHDAYFKENNVNYSEGAVTIKGVANLVSSGLKGELIGDESVMQEDGVKDSTKAVSQTFSTEYIEIGGWNMDTDASLGINLDVADTDLISVEVTIINDAQNVVVSITDAGSWSHTSPTLTLFRDNGGGFDNANYNDATINRGFVKYSYIS